MNIKSTKNKKFQQKKAAKSLRRLQKQRRSSRLNTTKQPPKRIRDKAYHNNCIYRFFKEEWQADELVKGNVWISTIETCREYEDPMQGDPDEATMVYNSGTIAGDGDDPNVQLIARRTGISIGNNCKNITIRSF